MPIFGVTLRRETSESAWLEVEADSAEEAKQTAIARSLADEYAVNWQIGDTDTDAEIDGEEDE